MANSVEVLMDVLEYIEANIAGELSVEEIAKAVSTCLAAQSLIQTDDAELERCAFAVNDRIGDPELRNLHILAAV